MQIGCFRRDADGFIGRVRTLALDVSVRLIPTGFAKHDRAPDWRIHLVEDGASGAIGPEIGSGWQHERKEGGSYVTIQFDCPSFPRPLRANLLPSKHDDDAYRLLWSPRSRRPRAQ